MSVAYKTLSNPKTRAAYDLAVALAPPASSLKSNSDLSETGGEAYTGLETVDLDDMTYSPEGQTFFRSCRCGKERGFEVTERQLEDSEQEREVVVGCQGCSLWLRITFAVAPEED